jgi:hypothetical protein
MTEQSDPWNESPKVIPEQKAFQGEKSGRMRVVLGVSVTVAAVVMIGMAMMNQTSTGGPKSPPATSAVELPHQPAPSSGSSGQ